MKRKACRRQVKAELRDIEGAEAARDAMRRAWIASRCRACGRCPKHIAKLEA